ncbi:TIGR00730 family Rossman fold protein [Myxococcaceae bacterium JPH2]|nr:TIGR00730 family Rossman fold protein [Myxococcaceae bacterium JPH2]
MAGSLRSVCVFCGSRPGARPEFREAATALGEELARRGLTLVYGGARVGLMGAVADGVVKSGGHVVGVLPRFMREKELAHGNLGELIFVDSMHERKALMAERSDAFIAMPGGFGTLDELFEITTWAQLGLHQKPMGLLDVGGYFQPLLAMVRGMVDAGFVPEAQAVPYAVSPEPRALVERLLQGPALPPVEKWLRRPEQT